MAKRRRKNGWIPEILWQLFRNRARTLAGTITSLVPRPSPEVSEPPEQCRRCETGQRCLSCCGEDCLSFLVRDDDPVEYRNLLKNCFVVVSGNAPPFVGGFDTQCRLSLIEVLRRAIEMLMCEGLASNNLLCSGYDKLNRSSSVVKLLNCSTWDLLLERVGDEFMTYLLKWTSIFVPQTQTNFHQVAGPPITNLCYASFGHKPQSQFEQPSQSKLGSRKKRKANGDSGLSSEIENAGSSSRHSDPSDMDSDIIVHQLSPKSIEKKVNPKKRIRPFSWQRRRERKVTQNESLNPVTSIEMGKESSCMSFHCGPDTSSLQVQDKCYCCSALEVPRKVRETAPIRMHSVLYNPECFTSILPSSHMLIYLKPSYKCANTLLMHIFGLEENTISPSMACSRSSCSCPNGFACLYHSLLKIFKSLICRAQFCNFSRLFDKHCTVPSFDPESLKCNESENSIGLNESYCLKSQVVSFVWAACRKIIPPDLLGTSTNWRILRRNISRFIRLRKYESFSLRQCMHKVKTSKFSLFSKKQALCYLNKQSTIGCIGETFDQKKGLVDASDCMKRRLSESWIFWLFSCLVVPLIQANFYVTDSEHGKNDLFYYRKSDWKKLTERVIATMKDQNYIHLKDSSVRKILRSRSFGFSKLRLCPKGNRVRLLANLKGSSRMPSTDSLVKFKDRGTKRNSTGHSKKVKPEYFKPVNSLLRDLHAVLKGFKMKDPDKLGSSVFSHNDIYKVICPFIRGLKNGSTIMPSVYIVISDVVKAFDTVDQDKLLGVVRNLMLQDEYILRKTHQVCCRNKFLWVKENLTLMDQINSCYTKSHLLNNSSHGILVNKEFNRRIRRSALYSDLNEHLKHNIMQLDGKFYLQGLGIPQGSLLSTLLCSFYYGDLDKNVIYPFLEKACQSVAENSSSSLTCPDVSSPTLSNADTNMLSLSPKYALLRFVDDFLFISTSKKQATSFFTRLQRGFRDYNCFMNKEKSFLSFESHQISGSQSNRAYVGEDGISYIRWCGLCIKSCSFEIQADYTSYLKNHLSSALTVVWQDKPSHLKEKLCSFLRPKCHPLFYDSNINSAAVVRLNIYQSLVVCAMKFHCYVSNFSYICKLPTAKYLSSIEESFRYLYELIRKRMRPSPLYHASGFQPVLRLTRDEVEWLGLTAYVRVLKKKQSQHKELLSLLGSKLQEHRIGQKVSPPLKYAVDDCHSSLLWKIKY